MRNTLVLITILLVSAVIGLSACGAAKTDSENTEPPFPSGLTIQLLEVGLIIQGDTITVLVTSQEGPVERAQVEVNDKDIGETDVNGLISMVVPNEDELTIRAVWGELGGELKIDLLEI